MSFCAIDFGTSNSAVMVPRAATSIAGASGMAGGSLRARDRAPGNGRLLDLVAVEGTASTLPTAIFYHTEDGTKEFGRAAVQAYTIGHEGRLLRSLKSILGSKLIDESTHMGDGIVLRYIDLIAAFIRHLKIQAERTRGESIDAVVLGRPVHFHDDDAAADAAAEKALALAARAAGFREVAFQLEPIAAALDYESQLEDEQLVFIADIGGGTSDFSVIRVGPKRAQRLDRGNDVLANDGVHVAGTDFDQRVEMWGILPLLGYQSKGPTGREVPSRVYFDLATWHLINSLYLPRRLAEIEAMRYFYGEEKMHRRLMQTLRRRLGHALLARAEEAKIKIAEGSSARIEMDDIEEGLQVSLTGERVLAALSEPIDAIAKVAERTVKLAGIAPEEVGAIYFTGGSTGLGFLADRLARLFPNARPVFGNRFASVVAGLGIHAQRLYQSA
ncbi:MAG: Hsp70 family protein [Burkholderiaceae bacterium]